MRDRLGWSQHVAEMHLLVAEDYRGLGLGRTLLQHAFTMAVDGGAEKLCARMTPAQARAKVAGSIFEAPATTACMHPDLRVTHRRWVEGHEWHRVQVADAQPPPGFAAVAPNLEDAYMVLSHAP